MQLQTATMLIITTDGVYMLVKGVMLMPLCQHIL